MLKVMCVQVMSRTKAVMRARDNYGPDRMEMLISMILIRFTMVAPEVGSQESKQQSQIGLFLQFCLYMLTELCVSYSIMC